MGGKGAFMVKSFNHRVFSLAVPIILQDFIMAALNYADVAMVGQLGEFSIAAVGLSNQFYFLFFMAICGISNGVAVFSAQYWGKKDFLNIRKILGIGLSLNFLVTIAFFIPAFLIPERVLSLYTLDPIVIGLGKQYLKTVSWSYIFTAVTFTYVFILRSMGMVNLPMIGSLTGVISNIFLNYCLIFGKLGFPVMGITGAAIGTVIARAIELFIVIGFTYFKKYPIAAKIKELISFNFAYLWKILSVSFPVFAQTIIWALSSSVYQAIYARVSTEAVAAVSIVSSIERFVSIFFVGIAHSAGIMIGNRIGEGREDLAFRYGRNFIGMTIRGSIIGGAILVMLRGPLLSMYKLNSLCYDFAFNLMLVSALLLWARSSNVLLIMGIFRSGGDTRTGMILDTLGPWLIGIPAALVAAFVFHLPIYWIVLFAGIEELFKLCIGYPRFFSKRWLRNLVQLQE